MQINIPKGTYVVAVSGGVDSMSLLDMLVKQQGSNLVVAHYNHGIRIDSDADEKLVKEAAEKYNLTFEAGRGYLGSDASEELARNARYKFLNSVKSKYRADRIITAHHQDDLIETSFINILRGSGHRGLVAMKINRNILRPLLLHRKEELICYAKKHNLKWHEDQTNQEAAYLRNYIRKNIMPRLSDSQRQGIIRDIEKVAESTEQKDSLLATISQNTLINNKIQRRKYISLPGEVRNELIMFWLRSKGVYQFDRKVIERTDIILKTARAKTVHPVTKELWLELDTTTARFASEV